MRSAHYRFDHSWHVDAEADAVLTLLEDVRGYERWWPSVRVAGGGEGPGAREARLVVRAPAGYRIRIALHEVDRQPGELRARISGDLEGWCAWRVTAEGAGSRVDFAQEVEARKPLLRVTGPLLHRALAGQHAAVMRAAAEGMQRAVIRP